MVGGFSLSTQEDLDPYYAIYPSPQIRGAVRSPSTADVYVDGRLVSSVRLPPGQFTLRDLPIETGFGNARVIIRDAFGRQQSINLGFYLSTKLLKGGEQDYSYVAGLERTSSGTKVEYGRAMGTAVHNIGLTDSLTIGFQAEGAKDLAMAGAGFNARLWRLGTFGAEGLASQTADKATGYAATGVYSFLSNWFSTDLRATWIGPKFQNLFLEPADRPQVTADATTSFSLGRLGSLTVGGTLGGPDALTARISQINPDFLGRLPEDLKRRLQDALATQHDKLLRLGYTLNLTSRTQLSLNAARVNQAGLPTAWEGFASLTFALGWRTVASAVTTVDKDGEALTSVNVQRSLPLGPGFGFRLDADAQDSRPSWGHSRWRGWSAWSRSTPTCAPRRDGSKRRRPSRPCASPSRSPPSGTCGGTSPRAGPVWRPSWPGPAPRPGRPQQPLSAPGPSTPRGAWPTARETTPPPAPSWRRASSCRAGWGTAVPWPGRSAPSPAWRSAWATPRPAPCAWRASSWPAGPATPTPWPGPWRSWAPPSGAPIPRWPAPCWQRAWPTAGGRGTPGLPRWP